MSQLGGRHSLEGDSVSMLRVRILVFAVPLMLLTIACGSSTTPTTSTSDNSGATTGSTVSAGSATSTEVVTPASAGTSSATSVVSASPPAGGLSFVLDPSQSEASYKATEQLAGISSPTDAVGQTSDVSGTIVFDANGAVVSSASKITIDLTTLTSDKSQRDNYIKRSTLNTNKYPDAVFVPTSVSGLPWPLPTTGQATFTISGNLTAHGVTKPTAWNATATFYGSKISGSATTEVKFEDFGMSPPRTMLVLSVEDHLSFTLQFVFTPSR
jgi:polyisoprenoid-binding protein YceI